MAMLRELLGSQEAAGAAGDVDLGPLAGLLGALGEPGAGAAGPDGGAGMEGLSALLGAGGGQKKASDAFFTDRLPLLQKVKRPLLAAFFGFAFRRGWVGWCGFLQGLMSGSYFNVLAVPLRVLPESPLYGRAFFVAQVWVDSGFGLLGFLLNWARGKTSPAKVFKSWATAVRPPDRGASDAPTLRTVESPPPPPQATAPSARGVVPPTIDAVDVTFLD